MSTRIFCQLMVCIAVSCPSGKAALIWSWSFDQEAYLVDPNDEILITATIFNSVLSDENLTVEGGVGASFTGESFQSVYDFTFGPTGNSSDFRLELMGLSLPPGDSFGFAWGRLKPIGGQGPQGTYFSQQAFLGIADGREPENSFTVTVVPEPPVFATISAGLLVMTYRALRLRSVRASLPPPKALVHPRLSCRVSRERGPLI